MIQLRYQQRGDTGMRIQYEREAVRFVPEVPAELDEIEAIARANKSIADYGTIPHEAINWD